VFAEFDGVPVGGVRVEVGVVVTPSLDFESVDAETVGDGACGAAWLELFE
jgi:hypothetical protein